MKKLLLFSALGMSIAVSATAMHFNQKYQPFTPDVPDADEMECSRCLTYDGDTYCATASNCFLAYMVAYRMVANE